ncbi:MAG TPA: hypothetical protein VIH64_16500 [Streptosporangiaceae bacterium]
MRSAHSRPVTVGLATGLFVITSGVTGTALASTSPPATASASASGTVSSAATKVTSSPSTATATSSTTAAASSPTATASSPTATPTATGTGPTGSTVSATNPAATPTPTPTPSTSTSATPTPTPKPVADIAVTASATSVQPGATILFRISAYTNLSAGATGKITSTLTPSAKTPAFSAPAYTVGCTSAVGTTCNLSVPAAKPSAPQVETQVTVPKTATAGETVKYSATVTVTDGSATLTATASAPTITVAKAAASPSATPSSSTTKAAAAGSPSASTPGGSTVDIPGLSGTTDNVGAAIPLGALPAVAGVSTTIPAGNASTLFPQISPSASPSPAPGTTAATPAKAEPVADSSRIPLSLSSSEFGAQIVGLIVLLLGVAIAVTRLSLRKTRPSSNK